MDTKRIGNFIVDRIVELPEIRVKLWVLHDENTNAQVLHCETDDDENSFCISFSTRPDNSQGAAHILEHTVLCGSKRFPVKDPFFLMQRRSLNTFLNAFTGGDFTCYPAATQNSKDFYNLLDVYLDAVFNPTISRLSFLQEGHRLEYNQDGKLGIQGIVFNEMKGALANPMSRLEEEMNSRLLKGLTYANNSGGDPKEIPDLTHEALIQFHKDYYHPSRAIFYFYGNIPLEKHLNFLEEKILKERKKESPLPPLPLLKRLEKPLHVKATYPIAKEEDPLDKTIVSSAVITCSILDQVEALALTAMTVILLETDASPLKMALLKSGLCKQVLANIDTEISEIPISITLKGVKSENSEALLETLRSLIIEIASTPFQKEWIDSAMHQLELSRKEISHDHLPYGLNLFMRAGLLMQNGGKPEDALSIHTLFNEVKKRIEKNPLYLNELMKKYLVQNPHRVDLILEPDQNQEERELALEQEKIAAIEKKLNETEKKRIVEEAKALEALQDSEDLDKSDILPMLNLTDIPKKSQDFQLNIEKLDQSTIYFHDCFTNDIVYAALSFNLPRIEIHDLPYLRLFVLLLTQLGTSKKSYKEMLEWMQAKTGGVFATLSLNQQIQNPNECQPTLQIQGKSLDTDVADFFKIISLYATNPNFLDQERIKEVLLKHYTGLRGSITSSSLKYASGLATKGFNTPSFISQKLFGLDWFWSVKEWVENLESALPKIVQKLHEMIPIFMGGERELILSCTQENYAAIKKEGFFGLTKGSKPIIADWKKPFAIEKSLSQGRIVSSPVAFISCAMPTVNYVDPKSPAIHLASCFLDNKVLHTAIREKGGAYGGGSSYYANSGIFSFYSYRDPNISRTIQAFADSIKELTKEEISEDELVEGKLEMIQGFDSPVSPGSRAMVAWNWLKEGKTTAMRQAYRDRLVEADQKVVKTALKECIESHFSKDEVVVAFAGKELLEKENSVLEKLGKKPLPIYSVEDTTV